MERIDIARILKDKNPKAARWVPGFVVRFVEWLICAKQLNRVLETYRDCNPIDFTKGMLATAGVEYRVHGIENVPKDQRLLFASNHPLGGVDGMILAVVVEQIQPNVRLIVNDILLNIEPMRPLFVGVNKHGGQDCSFAQRMDDLYRSSSPIINFPAGLCSRMDREGEITDTPWRKSFVVRCQSSNRVVVPTFVRAFNSPWFYRIARWRVKLGIKVNLEMILLPRQMFYQKGRVVDIFFGTPITLDSSLTPAQWCDLIRTRSYDLWNNRS